MKKDQFEELLESVKQAGAMKHGKRRASRIFKYLALDVKKIATKWVYHKVNFHALFELALKPYKTGNKAVVNLAALH